MNRSVVFFGTGPVAASSLEFIKQHFAVEAVVTKPRASHHKGPAPVEDLCNQLNLPLFFANNKASLDHIIGKQQLQSPLGIVVDFGIIISRQVIDSFPLGIVNSHFSLLPEWRGADPISYSILSGQPKTGVSLMRIEPTLDTGKLLTQRTIHIDTKETTGTLTTKLVRLSNQLLLEYLPRYTNGELTLRQQPHPDRATYSHKLSKSDATIDWTEDAHTIERKIRAYQPWPKARTRFGKLECIITDADVVPSGGTIAAGTISCGNSGLIVVCGRDSLSINTLQPLGKKEMPVKAFLSGYRNHLSS